MYGTKERLEATSKLTLERREEILRAYFNKTGDDPKHLTERQRDALVRHLRELGYHAPYFDMAFRLMVSRERSKPR